MPVSAVNSPQTERTLLHFPVWLGCRHSAKKSLGWIGLLAALDDADERYGTPIGRRGPLRQRRPKQRWVAAPATWSAIEHLAGQVGAA